jgi:uncharacterized protein YjbI with pentapeptide repeats
MSVLWRAQGTAARFRNADLHHADLSHADVTDADFSGATLTRARLHAVQDADALWPPSKVAARGDDVDLREAEQWQAAVLRGLSQA